MKRITAAMIISLTSACFQSPSDLPLGRVDGGATGGGTPTGGGTGTGGGTTTGGGSGSDCVGVPDHLTPVNCTQSTLAACEATASAMRASHPGTCEPNGKGGVATLSCGGFEVVAHTSSLTTVECFYEADGGALAGALNFTDLSIGAWGAVADCQRTAQVPCLDGGLVPSLATLPMADCGKAVSFQCPNDAGPCITWDTPTSQQVVATREQLEGLQSIEGVVGDSLLFLKNSADGGTDMGTAAPNRNPNVVASSERLSLSGLAPTASGPWWFVGTYGTSNYRYDVASAAHNSGVSVAMPSQTSSATSNGAAYNSWYFVALSDGLYSYYPAGGSRLVTLSAINGDSIQSIAADEASDAVFYVRFDTVNGHRLWRIARTGASGSETMMTQLPRMNGVSTPVGGMLSVHGNHVYVLSVRGVYRVPLTGGQLELVYRGEEFPQYGGTLKNGSLVRHGDKLYFGEVCYFDADAPGYGTVELDLTQLNARWLDLDPAYPLVPHVTGYQSWEKEGPVYASPSGAFIVRQ